MTKLKIATWNLNRPFYRKSGYIRDGLQESLRTHAENVDILVLTETDTQFRPDGYTHVAESRHTSVDGHEETERWVSVWIKTNSDYNSIDKVETADLERTSCAIVSIQGIKILTYGTVLPWWNDRWHCFDEKRAFHAALMLQSAEWRYLKRTYSLPLIVAGDFNQHLYENKLYSKFRKNKDLLIDVLKDCNLQWDWNGQDLVAQATKYLKPPLATIDHICVSEHFKIVQKECWPRTDDSGKQLTDHFGSLVEVELSAR